MDKEPVEKLSIHDIAPILRDNLKGNAAMLQELGGGNWGCVADFISLQRNGCLSNLEDILKGSSNSELNVRLREDKNALRFIYYEGLLELIRITTGAKSEIAPELKRPDLLNTYRVRTEARMEKSPNSPVEKLEFVRRLHTHFFGPNDET